MNGQLGRLSLRYRIIVFCHFLVIGLLCLGSRAESAPLAAVANSQTSVTLTWTAPGDDLDVGTATAYSIRYSTSVIDSGNWLQATEAINPPAPKLADSDESFDVNDLEAGTLYYFAIKAVDEVGNWALLSTVVSAVTTVEMVPPATISDLSVGNPTETGLVLTWTAPGEDGDIGQASQYDIRYSTSPIDAGNWNSAIQVNGEPEPAVAGSSESYSVTSLASGTVYYFAIITADEFPNWSGLSNVASLSTGADQTPPATISNLTVVASGQ